MDLVLVGVRVIGVELEDVAGVGADEVLVELGDDRAGADLVEVVVGGEAVDGLAVLGAGDVDRDVVAVGRGALDLGELAVLAAQAVDLLVDLLVGRLGVGDLDAEAVVARRR